MDRKQIQKRLADALARMDEMLEAGLTDENRAEYDSIEKEAETLRADLTRIEDQEKRKKWAAEPSADNPPNIVMGDGPEDRNFGNFGEVAHAIVRASAPGGVVDPRLAGMNHRAATGLGEAVPSDGGFLLEEQYVGGIMRRVYDSPIISRCRQVTVGANSNSITLKEVDESSRADGSRLGGVRGYWRDEAATVTASKPAFANQKIDLDSLMVISYATDEMLEDVSVLNSLLPDMMAEEIEFKLGDAIINGTGAGQPLGIANSSALVTQTKETGQVAATIVPENIAKMWSRAWARSRGNMVWIINQDCEPQLHTMTLDAGTAGFPVYLPPGGFSSSPYGMLYGRPVIPVEFAQTLGTTGDIQLVDFSEYLLARKGGVEQAVSMHVQFLYAEQVFRAKLRVGGQPLWSSALTPYKGTNTQSPFIWLAARS
jgi:HK97 family phage major capsid protein